MKKLVFVFVSFLVSSCVHERCAAYGGEKRHYQIDSRSFKK